MYTNKMEQDTLYKFYSFLEEVQMVVTVVLVVQAVSDSWIQ